MDIKYNCPYLRLEVKATAMQRAGGLLLCHQFVCRITG
jgi:hypothetical protein